MKYTWLLMIAFVFALGCGDEKVADKSKSNSDSASKADSSNVDTSKKTLAADAVNDGKSTAGSELADAKDDGGSDLNDTDKVGDGFNETKTEKAEMTEKAEKTETVAKLNARTVLKDSMAQAAADNKKLFVHFGAPW